MSLQTRLEALVAAIGADVKTLSGPKMTRSAPRTGSTKGNRIEDPIAVFTESTSTGPITIGLPAFLTANATGYMFRIQVSGYDYTGKKAFKVVAAGNITNTVNVIGNPQAVVQGQLLLVRWGWSGGRLHLILGEDTDAKGWVGVNVDSLDVWYGPATEPTYAQMMDWTTSVTTLATSMTGVIAADNMYTWKVLPLTAPWVAYGGIYQVPVYRLTEGGQVEIQGVMKSGAAGATVSTLPVGYRPAGSLIFICDCQTGFARVEISAAGVLQVQAFKSSGTNVYVALAGVIYTPWPHT